MRLASLLAWVSAACAIAPLPGCAAEPSEEVASSTDAVSSVRCGDRSTGTAYERGQPSGEVVLYQVGGQPMEARMVRAFRRLMAVHSPVAISPAGWTVFRTMAQQTQIHASTPALAATPGWSNHQSGHAVDLDASSLPRTAGGAVDEATLACFGFARPYTLDERSALVETRFGHFARRRYVQASVPPGKTLEDIRRQVAGEAWHYEFDEELEAEQRAASEACKNLHARAEAKLGGDGACGTGTAASGETCTSASLGREVASRACVFIASTATWNLCTDGEWSLGTTPDACGAVTCASLGASARRCPLDARNRATDVRSGDASTSLCAVDGAIFPSVNSLGEGAGRDWQCSIGDCPPDAAHCWR